MAREIPRMDRQVMESPLSLPQYSGAARLSEMLGTVSNKIGALNTKLQVEKATLEGAKNRIEGEPKKLMPNLTPATQAYNEAFVNMDSALIYSSTIQGMAEDYLMAAQPGSLAQGGASKRYLEAAQARIQGSLSQAMEQGKPELALKLQQQAHNDALKLESAQLTYDYDQTRSKAAVALKQGADIYAESIKNGHLDIAKEHAQDLFNNIESQLKLGYITPLEAYNYKEQLIQVGINSELERSYIDAYALSEDEAAKLVNDWYTKETPGITNAQKEGGLQHLLGVHSRLTSSMTMASQIGFDNIAMRINTGTYGSIDALREDILTQSQSGHPINLHQQFQLESAYLKSLKGANKKAQTNAEITKKLDSPEITLFTNKQLDDWFTDVYKARKEQRNILMETAATPAEKVMASTPDWMIGASIVSHVKYAPINAYQGMLHTQLMNGSTDDRINAAKAFNFLEVNNPAALEGMSKKDVAFVNNILDRLENTNIDPNTVVEDAVNNILKIDDTVFENRQKELNKYIKDNPKAIANLTKDIFGKKLPSSGGMGADIMYSTVQKEFDNNFMLTGNAKDAAKLTSKHMAKQAGVSEFGAPGVPIWNPPENLPFYGFGNIVQNQFAQAIDEVVRNAEKYPGTLNVAIKASKKMPAIPAYLSDKEKMLGNYFKGEGWLNINGEDKRVFLVSPSYNQANALGNLQYLLMYDDGGVSRPVPSVVVQLDANGNPVPRPGNSVMQFKSPDQYVPQLLNKMQKELADADTTKAAERKFNAINPSLFKTPYSLMTTDVYDDAPATVKKSEEFKEYLKSFKTDVPAQIEEEKLRREAIKAVKNP